MTTQPNTNQKPATPDTPVRPVIEHALTDYGYSPGTIRTLIDRLITEAEAE